MDARPYQRIAIIKPCCIGDCVMSLPVLQTLARRYKAAEIDVFVGNHSRAVFEGRPDVAAIRPVVDVPAWRDVPRLTQSLRVGRHDLIVVLDRSRYVRLAARLADADTVTFLERGPDNTRHESDLCLDTLRAIGIEPQAEYPEVHISAAAADRARDFRSRIGGRYVVLHPGGAENPGAMMPSKRWPLDRWSELACWAREQGFQIVLTGSPSERKLCDRLADRLGGGVHIAAGELGLIESTALIAGACLFVGPDTGLSHLAAATGTPTLAIFGPTNPVRYSPRGPCVRVIAPPESSRLPDVDLRNYQKPDPAVATERVAVSDVVSACVELLSERPRDR